MRVSSIFRHQARYIAVAAMVLLAVIVPLIASAAQITERSIALSSASKSAEDVSYEVKFTAATAAAAYVIDFCTDPIVGQDCTAPAGLDASGAASTGPTIASATTSQIFVTDTITAAENVSAVITGITNPSDVGPFYARIVTYDTAGNAADYVSDNLGTGAKDDGSVAIFISDTIGVSGAVLETMSFCVSGAVIGDNCAVSPDEEDAPTIKLGTDDGNGNVSLTPGVLSTGNIYTQLTTNSSKGAIVSLKSSALNCGGLLRAGAPTACDIAPALADGIAVNGAEFGVRTSTATSPAGSVGILQPFTGSVYNNTTYMLNYADLNASGVTSTYGDPFLDTDGDPASNQNMQLVFGAQVNNNTPAGLYSTNLSLIATGKF